MRSTTGTWENPSHVLAPHLPGQRPPRSDRQYTSLERRGLEDRIQRMEAVLAMNRKRAALRPQQRRPERRSTP